MRAAAEPHSIWQSGVVRAEVEAADVVPPRVPPELLEPPSVDALLRSVVAEWTGVLLLWALIALTPLWSYPLWAILLAGRFHAMGVILHDACHNAPRDLDLRWSLLEILGGYPLGTSIDAMRHHHLRHHRRVNMIGDPYFHAVDGRRLRTFLYGVAFGVLPLFWMLRAPIGVAAHRCPQLRDFYGCFLLQTSGNLTHNRQVIRCARRDHGVLIFLLLLIIWTIQIPSIAALGYWVPLALTGWTIGIRFLVEHRYVRVCDRKPSTLMSHTRNHHVWGPLTWVLTPRNAGYHLVHHLHPRVANYALPRLHRWYAENHPGYPNGGSIGGVHGPPIGTLVRSHAPRSA